MIGFAVERLLEFGSKLCSRAAGKHVQFAAFIKGLSGQCLFAKHVSVDRCRVALNCLHSITGLPKRLIYQALLKQHIATTGWRKIDTFERVLQGLKR
ncbi:hypothetical protein HC891_00685 [Candidatus Gracilibacteria bacterium]|nr:hypothetical protein [Candidatus Gracilibacteria bacterium]